MNINEDKGLSVRGFDLLAKRPTWSITVGHSVSGSRRVAEVLGRWLVDMPQSDGVVCDFPGPIPLHVECEQSFAWHGICRKIGGQIELKSTCDIQSLKGKPR